MQVNSPVEVVSALAGTLRLSLCAQGNAPSLEVEDVFVVIRPRQVLAQPVTVAPEAQPPSQQAETSIHDGLRVVASGLEALRRRMTMRGSRIVVQVEVPQGPGAVVVNLDSLAYLGVDVRGPEGLAADGSKHLHMETKLTFAGCGSHLVMHRDQDGPPTPLITGSAGQPGCSGLLRLKWSCEVQRTSRPFLDLHLQLQDGLELHLQPHTFAALADIIPVGTGTTSSREAPARHAAPSAPASQWGTTSLMEALLLPDGESFLMGMLSDGTTEQEDVEEFFDASSSQSLLSSAQGSPASSFMHSSAFRVNACSDEDVAIHDMTASIRQVSCQCRDTRPSDKAVLFKKAAG